MKYILMALCGAVVVPLVVLWNVFLMLWHFEINPVVKTETGFDNTGETFEIRAWDGLLGIDKKQRSNFKR